MTQKEYQKILDKRVKDTKIFADALKAGSYTATAQMGERIFDTGKETDGSSMGSYSTKPLYVSLGAVPKPKGAPTGKPSGKTSQKKITQVESRLDQFGDEVTTGRRTRRVTIGTQTVAIGGKSKFADGEPHKSKYFVTGYKGYRENVGRQTAFVDLSMTGEMRLDFGNDKTIAQPRKITDFEYQIRLDKESSQDKRAGAEAKYGTIFDLTTQELQIFHDTVSFEFRKRLA